jgi:GTP-binding protein
MEKIEEIRNIAIIAHVDHGKTTLVDALLRQSKSNLSKDLAEEICIMDSNDIERERGITIFSKNAAVYYGDIKINIIDTPGHADFGGEVERVLNMADGCLLLVDAKEGPMPQTRFVLKKALQMGHKIIVVINKIDKKGARPDFALNATFDLFVELGADDKALEFPVLYASGIEGKAGTESDINKMENIIPIFDSILKHIPKPSGDPKKPLQILVTSIADDNFKGRIAIGRVHNGIVKNKQEIMYINRQGVSKKYQISSLMTFAGLNRIDVEEAKAGDIVAIAGIPEATIGETITDPLSPEALPVISIEEPTVKMNFMANNSPFSGKEGHFSTSRQILERLRKELETDVALRVEETGKGDWIVSGRGELHLSILIERMRRQGYEFQVSRPQVIIKEIDGQKMTPFERVFIEVPTEYQGVVLEKMGYRKGELKDMKTVGETSFLEFVIPTRGLLGYRSELLTDTKGLGIINSAFENYQKDPGGWKERNQGSLVSCETGPTNMYGLRNIQSRGILFFRPGVMVYEGQVIGQNSRSEDIRVNVCKEKKLSNMRSKGEGSDEHFNTPKTMELEDALKYIDDDELVEVTPLNVRIRKKHLKEIDEKREKRKNE